MSKQSFVDFEAVKNAVSIEDAAAALKLITRASNGQLRGPCPRCKSGGDRTIVITPSKGVFFCFAERKGGDQIALVAHIKDLPAKDAAAWLAEGMTPSAQRAPESETSGSETKKLAPLAYLEPENEMVIALGFDTDFCKKHGIGFSPKGIMRGTVAIPFRDGHGTLLGYIGVEDCRLPADFTPNVVVFKKSA